MIDFLERSQIVLSMIGICSITLLGIKRLSQHYQRLNDEQIQKILIKEKEETNHPFFTGLSLASLIQSATLVIGLFMNFIHAKYIKIERSFFLVWGANVGTTLGLWVLIIPAKDYVFLTLGLGFLISLLFTKTFGKSLGQIIIGLGLIFLSLKIFEEYLIINKVHVNFFEPLDMMKLVISYIWLFLASFILPSSIILLGPLLLLVKLGQIPLSYVFIGVIVINLGSSLKAISYVRSEKHNSHLLGYMHILLNLISFWVFLLLIIFTPFYFWIDSFFSSLGMSPAIKVVSFNTIYNLFMGWGIIVQSRYIKRYQVIGDKEDELYHWSFDSSLIPAIPLLLAKDQISDLVQHTSTLMELSKTMSSDETVSARDMGKIKVIEGKTDRIHADLRRYLSSLMKQKLNLKQSAEALGYLRIADDLESLADYVDELVSLRTKYKGFYNDEDDYWSEFLKIENALVKYFFDLKKYFMDLNLSNKNSYIEKLDHLRERTHHLKKKLALLMIKDTKERDVFLAFTDMHYCLNKMRTHLFKLTEELGLIYDKKTLHLNS